MTLTQPESSDVVLLETPFLSQGAPDETIAYLKSKYNLALVALGSYLRVHSDAKVSIINMVRDCIDEDALIEKLRAHPPKIIATSLYTNSLNYSYRILTRIKQEFPDIHTCVGGPHTGLFPRETMNLAPVDSMVLGDGELPFLGICQQVLNSGRLNDDDLPPGTCTKASMAKGGMPAPWVEPDLDSLPLPDLTLLGDHRRFRDFLSNKVLGLITGSRGCPFACNYCSSKFSKYRHYSVQRVVEMMRHYVEHGIEYIEFWDETFNPNKRRMEQFADCLEQANLNIQWAVRGAVVLHAPYDTLVRLRKLGLRTMQFGVESGNPRLIKWLNKHQTSEQIIETYDNCQRAGIRTIANLITNIPTQTRQEILDDFKFLKKIKATYHSISLYNWSAGTEHYLRALNDGLFEEDYWREFAAHPTGPEPLRYVETNEVSVEEMFRLRDRFAWRFYFNLPYIIRYARTMPFCELKRSISIAALMLKSRVQLAWRSLKQRIQTGHKQSSSALDLQAASSAPH